MLFVQSLSVLHPNILYTHIRSNYTQSIVYYNYNLFWRTIATIQVHKIKQKRHPILDKYSVGIVILSLVPRVVFHRIFHGYLFIY